VSGGHVVVSPAWDGNAGNGMRVAPGGYIVTVTATDPLGNVVSAYTLTTVQY
jgi:hypothetical protein